MMTASSIGAGDAQGYSQYLESRTVAPSRGDYYLSDEGLPTEAQGRWQMFDETLAWLGVERGEPVRAQQLVALMEGRHPASGEFLRRTGADGRRAAGIDLTFSAPKSVSALWAIGSAEQRKGIEAAHGQAVQRTLTHLREHVPAVRRGAGGERLEVARDLLAAEFLHTTARGVQGGQVPDPQLHSHVVISGVVRQDGAVAAVASRPLFRSARELGSYYRSALAQELRGQGYGITTGTGKDGRYFELTAVPQAAREALSGRSREVWLAAERFRARYGRAPRRHELRNVKLENRCAKAPQTRGELLEAWRGRAGEHGLTRQVAEGLQGKSEGALQREDRRDWRERLGESLTAQRATFTRSELRAAILEQTTGERAPERIERDLGGLLSTREVVALQGGLFTTREIRRMEQRTIGRVQRMAGAGGPGVGEQHRRRAATEVAQRIGGKLSTEQQQALAKVTGPERVSVLVGQAGAGKGVVIDAAARAELYAGASVYGVAVAGATAERLGRESPALAGRTTTVDSLLARGGKGSLHIDERTTVYLDEAGMADTRRLDALTHLMSERGGRLVAIGDSRQLSSIGPGGLFARIAEAAPTAELKDIRRTSDLAEQRAWADLRAGRPEQAMAHYQVRGHLHMADTREQALEAAAQQWVQLAERKGAHRVALITDASNREIDRLNACAQHLLGERGHLGNGLLPLPDRPYGLREGDRVCFVAQHHPGEGQRRVENGTGAEVIGLDPHAKSATVRTDAGGREVTLAGEEQLAALRLGYAQHLYRQQGATVDRAVVVTGGWQTSREGAYVQASRAREGTDWHLAREDLGSEGKDADRVERLAELMRASRAQTPSIDHQQIEPPQPDRDLDRDLERSTEPTLDPNESLEQEAGLAL